MRAFFHIFHINFKSETSSQNFHLFLSDFFIPNLYYMPDTQSPAILLLEDGTLARGFAFGAIGTTTGEICFNTGMTGYQEVFTDPSYYGQIVIMNAVHVGNYGVIDEDIESDSVKILGVIAKNLNENYSRKRAKGSLQEYLEKNNIVSIQGVDTRALVAHIRTKGAMNCIISSEILI